MKCQKLHKYVSHALDTVIIVKQCSLSKLGGDSLLNILMNCLQNSAMRGTFNLFLPGPHSLLLHVGTSDEHCSTAQLQEHTYTRASIA